MKRIAVDMDGVLANVTEHFLDFDERDFGRRKTWDEIAGRPELEVFPKLREYVYASGFFRTAPVMPDSQEILLELTKKYEVFIVSAATEFPKVFPEKQAWLNEHFSFIDWRHMVFCGLKTIIDADIMIDDHFRNLDSFKATTILFSQSHNVSQDAGKHLRVGSWREIARILL